MMGEGGVSAVSRSAIVAVVWARWNVPSRLASELLESRILRGISRVTHAHEGGYPQVVDATNVWFALVGDTAAHRAFDAALQLWERMVLELGIQVQIGVTASVVSGSDMPTGAPYGDLVKESEGLARAAQPSTILVARDAWSDFPNKAQGDARFDTPPLDAVERLQDALREEAHAPRFGHLVLPTALGTHLGWTSIAFDDIVQRPRFQWEDPVPLAPPDGHGAAYPYPPHQARSADIAGRLSEDRSFVLLGEVGSGKTTFLRWLTRVLLRGRLSTFRTLGTDFPTVAFFFRAADLVVQGLGTEETVFEEVLARDLARRKLGTLGLIRKTLTNLQKRGGSLLLIDGLDEVPGELRAEVTTAIAAFLGAHPKARCVLTARPFGLVDPTFALGPRGRILPLDLPSIERIASVLLQNQRGAEDSPTQGRVGLFLQAIRGDRALRALAGTPLSLPMLASVAREDGTLPHQRVQVYEAFVRYLTETWSRARRRGGVSVGPATSTVSLDEEAVYALGDLAFALLRQSRDGWGAWELIQGTLVACLERRGHAGPDAAEVADGFLRGASEVGLLVEHAPKQWGFLHLAIAEYLAVAALSADDRLKAMIPEWLFDPGRIDTLRLGVSYVRHVQRRLAAASRLVQQALRTRLRGPNAYVTETIEKHVPASLVLLTEAWSGLPEQERLIRRVVRWIHAMPIDVVELVLVKVRGTEVGRALAEQLASSLCKRKYLFETASALRVLGEPATAGPLLNAFASNDEDTPIHETGMLAWALCKTDTDAPPHAVELVLLAMDHLPPYLWAQLPEVVNGVPPAGLGELAAGLKQANKRHALALVLAAIDARLPPAEARALQVELLGQDAADDLTWLNSDAHSEQETLERISGASAERKAWWGGALLASGDRSAAAKVSARLRLGSQADKQVSLFLEFVLGEEQGLRWMERSLRKTLTRNQEAANAHLSLFCVSLIHMRSEAVDSTLRRLGKKFPQAIAPFAALLARGSADALSTVLHLLPKATTADRKLALGALWAFSEAAWTPTHPRRP